jgi:hypothetical protein
MDEHNMGRAPVEAGAGTWIRPGAVLWPLDDTNGHARA